MMGRRLPSVRGYGVSRGETALMAAGGKITEGLDFSRPLSVTPENLAPRAAGPPGHGSRDLYGSHISGPVPG